MTAVPSPEEVKDESAGVDRLSVVIVNWNGAGQLQRCVAAVGESTYVEIEEILVVDNASTDGSLASIDDLDGVRVIQTGANLGYGSGANRGIRESVAPYVAVLNTDVELERGALGRMVGFLSAELTCGIVGPRLLDASGGDPGSCGRRPAFWDAIGRKFLLHQIFPIFNFRLLRPRIPTDVGWVTGACTVARRSALDSVGGFDEAIFMYFEDLDLSERLRQAGWRTCFVPEAVGRHSGGGSSRQALERMLLVSEVSYRYFTRKHYGGFFATLLATLTPIEMTLRSLLWMGIYLVSGRRRSEAVIRLRAYRKAFLNDFRDAQPPRVPEEL